MIILAILFYLLGHYAPIWIYKNELNGLANQFSYKYIIMNMSGSVACFFTALLIICIITLTTPEKYLLNENAIYGIKCSPTVTDIGFQEGDRINTINSQKVDKFDEIISNILLCAGPAKVEITRGVTDTIITISDEDKLKLMRSNYTHFAPRENPVNSNKPIEKLSYSESQQTMSDAFRRYSLFIKMTFRMLIPQKSEYQNLGGFITVSRVNNIKGVFTLFSINLITMGFISLLPLPGLDLGNTIVGLVEKTRNQKFNKNKLKIVKTICITILGITLLLLFLIK